MSGSSFWATTNLTLWKVAWVDLDTGEEGIGKNFWCGKERVNKGVLFANTHSMGNRRSWWPVLVRSIECRMALDILCTL